jgi:RHS repeat-associated protein
VTNYYYNGSVLIGMQRGTAKELYSYDASGNVVSVNHNGTEYYYLRNAQGDIVKLIDASGATVVEYTYDTWGKKVQTTGSLAGSLGLVQPFRYRGYVYDWETGLYYLQSRYYDPTTGRFISADVLLSTGQGVLGHNAYAYCLDNPVQGVDPDGCFSWGQLFAVVAIAAVAAVAIAATVATAGAAGAAIGAAAAVYVGTTAATAVSTAVTIGGYAVAAGIGICAASDIGEVCTGTNVVRDYVCGGNQATYNAIEGSLYIAASCYCEVGSTYSECYSSSLSRLSTGRTEPKDLKEQLAMESVKSNPSSGRVIKDQLHDPRLPEGTVKMAQHINFIDGGAEIHYCFHRKYGYFDFKFKE